MAADGGLGQVSSSLDHVSLHYLVENVDSTSDLLNLNLLSTLYSQYFISDTSGNPTCGGIFYTKQFCDTIWVSHNSILSDTIYLALASDSIGKGLSP